MNELPFLGKVKNVPEYLIKMHKVDLGWRVRDGVNDRYKTFYTKKPRKCDKCQFLSYKGVCDLGVKTEKYREKISPLDYPYRPTQVCIPVKGANTHSHLYYADNIEEKILPELISKIKEWNEFLNKQ